jgi:monoamine oxidase
VHFQAKEGKVVRRDDFWDQIESVFSRLEKLHGKDQSFADFVATHCGDVSADAKRLATAYVEGLNAADQHVISAQSLAPKEHEEQEPRLSRLPAGQDRLIEWLQAGIDPELTEYRFHCVVTQVAWRRHQVTIHTQSGEDESYSAPQALITLPLGVLSQGAVMFEPDLPEKRAAMSQLRMGPVVKVLLLFREALWERMNLHELGFLYTPEEPFSPWWTLLPVRAPVLTGWAGGPAAERLSRQNEGLILDQALAGLARSLQVKAADLRHTLRAWHVCDWQIDPFSRGAYSYIAAGGSDAPQKLGQPVDETLFFAGEATHADLMGTVAGAIASGVRAAEEMLVA